MDLLTGNIRKLYTRYLAAAFGSALISSIYGMVDMAMVGQYQGPDGAAALAVVAPVWNIIYSLGLLTGIGGSVIFSARRGSAQAGDENEYFTSAGVSKSYRARARLVSARSLHSAFALQKRHHSPQEKFP